MIRVCLLVWVRHSFKLVHTLLKVHCFLLWIILKAAATPCLSWAYWIWGSEPIFLVKLLDWFFVKNLDTRPWDLYLVWSWIRVGCAIIPKGFYASAKRLIAIRWSDWLLSKRCNSIQEGLGKSDYLEHVIFFVRAFDLCLLTSVAWR